MPTILIATLYFYNLALLLVLVLLLRFTKQADTMSSPPYPKTTLWLWPTGLFPRCIIYYLHAKHLTLPILMHHNIYLVPATLNQDHTLILSSWLRCTSAKRQRPDPVCRTRQH
jgi:hypothetical protein